jgi:hypothetical protein
MNKIRIKLFSIYNFLKRKTIFTKKNNKLKNNRKISLGSLKNKKIVYFIGIFLLIIFLIHTQFLGIVNITKINLQKYPNDSIEITKKWDGRTNILVIGLDNELSENLFVDHISVLVINSITEEVGLFNISPDIIVSKISNKNITLRHILSSQNNNIDKINSSISFVENLLALKLDRYIIFNKEDLLSIFSAFEELPIVFSNNVNTEMGIQFKKNNKYFLDSKEMLDLIITDKGSSEKNLAFQIQIIKEMLKKLKSPITLYKLLNYSNKIESIYTNISQKEFLLLFIKVRSINDDKFKIAYTRTNNLAVIDDFGIYTKYNPNISQIDENLSTILSNINIMQEQATIEVVNGSGIRGLANIKARWLRNVGGRVIKVANNPEIVDTTVVFVDNIDNYESTLSEIDRIFQGEIIYKEKSEYKFRHIGDIIILLGEDQKN